MNTPTIKDIQITSGGGKGKIVKSWITKNPNPDHPFRYVASPHEDYGEYFPDGTQYMNNGRWELVDKSLEL